MVERQYKYIQLLEEEETLEETVELTVDETTVVPPAGAAETLVEKTEETEKPYQAVAITEEHGSLVTRTGNGKVNLCFITEGQGTSGYYDRNVLKQSYKLLEGRPMYIDHHRGNSDPGILYWVGDIESAYYDEKGIEGPGIYGTATVFERWKDVVEDMVQSRGGVSIKARGHSDEKGNIKNISVIESVDYVVRAGRGGRVMELFESAIAPKIVEENTTMGDKTKDKEVAEAQSDAITEEQSTETSKTVEEGSVSAYSYDPANLDSAGLKKIIAEMLSSEVHSIEVRLGLLENESTDREKVSKAVKEAAGDNVSESVLKHIEGLVWKTRRDGVDLEEQAKETVESLKPIFAELQESADKKIEEVKKEATNNVKLVPNIFERMNETYAGTDGEELSEEALEDALAKSVAQVIGTADVDTIKETIVSSRGE